MGRIKPYVLVLNDEEYARFRASTATRLYQHQRDNRNGEITIWASKREELCRDLELAIDFGATSASECLTDA